MKQKGILGTFILVAGLAGPAFADSSDVIAEQVWARASIGINRPGAAYLTVRNTGDEAVTLIGLATPLAMMPEVHETKTNAQGVSSMAPAGEIKIEPQAALVLEPGGLHAMLMGLQRPLIEGESFPLTLIFEGGGEVVVEVPILGVAANGPND